MNSAPVTLPCTSSTTATGGSARAAHVIATRPVMAKRKRFMLLTSMRRIRASLERLPRAGTRTGRVIIARTGENTTQRQLVLNALFEPQAGRGRPAAAPRLSRSARGQHHHALVLRP